MSVPLSQSETERTFLQSRVALLSLAVAAIGAFGLAVSLADAAPGTTLPRLWTITSVAQTSMWAALWLLCRGRPRSAAFYRAAEAICLLGTGVAMGAQCRMLGAITVVPGLTPLDWPSEFAGNYLGLHRLYWATAHMFGLSLFCALRAALVPSRPMRTLILTTLVGVPITVFAGVPWLPFDPTILESASIPESYAMLGAANIGMQWLFTVAVCTVLSKVIYGLRSELHHARQLGQYTLESKLGEGGMGVVYKAKHAMLRRPTAIKLLSASAQSDDQYARFEREVQETARLTHPNTITIFDYGRTPDGVFYYAMELLDGAPTDDVIGLTGPMEAARVVHVLLGVCGSLEEAHAAGLVHRDVKPANIVLCVQGGRPDVPKLLDFGLVKTVGNDADPGLTAAGTVSGTPMYMAPEMIARPDSVDERADIYAVGAVGYLLLTGKAVFEGRTVMEVCAHHLHSVPVAPSERLGSAIPADLEAILLDCLRKEPGARPQTAAEVSRRLLACDVGRPWSVNDAREWWDEYGAALVAQREARTSDVRDKTLVLDPAR